MEVALRPATDSSGLPLLQTSGHRVLSKSPAEVLSNRPKRTSQLVPTSQPDISSTSPTQIQPLGQRRPVDQQRARSLPGPYHVLHRCSLHRRQAHPIPLLAQTTGYHLNGKAKDHEHRKRKFTLGVHPMTIPDLTNSRSAVLPRSIRSRSVYVELSGGMAGVLLKKEPSEVEVFTDSDGRAVNFFRVDP